MALNEGLKKHQQKVHLNTIQIVKDTVTAMKELNPNKPISRKNLLDLLKDEGTERHAISPATLYKPEYLKIWNEKLYEKRLKNNLKVKEELVETEIYELKQIVSNLKKEGEKKESKINKLLLDIESLETDKKVARKERRELEDLNEKLYGLLLECDSLLALKGLSVSQVASSLAEGIEYITKKFN
ncbi:hypothetical protein [Fictibacillus sp. 26RED30]|uniref:hypothetical protein n=1 Tax=Fictibacillus sp. 26RED30 TaxID=2745877 RepID=UPI0018CE28B2|nr:hypothetical protein [Fictibacillus sp. 26RED30]MBH0162081.1 hypothetical protein [Fictibacillus sp. 26RED30]